MSISSSNILGYLVHFSDQARKKNLLLKNFLYFLKKAFWREFAKPEKQKSHLFLQKKLSANFGMTADLAVK